jgi:hypothetical protein
MRARGNEEDDFSAPEWCLRLRLSFSVPSAGNARKPVDAVRAYP